MNNAATRELSTSRKSPALLRHPLRDIAFPVQRIKPAVAFMLDLVWLPAVSCCLIDGSGLFGKRDWCSVKHSHSGGGKFDSLYGSLASATYLSQQDQLLIIAPVACAVVRLRNLSRRGSVRWNWTRSPRPAPPDFPGSWQFAFRTALPPRVPSFASYPVPFGTISRSRCACRTSLNGSIFASIKPRA